MLEGDLGAASTKTGDRHTAKLNRHAITVHFTRLIRPTGDTIAIDAVIAAVDNAKERVDSTGVIGSTTPIQTDGALLLLDLRAR